MGNIAQVMTMTKKMLIVDEGCKLIPYKDSVGLLTIGIGRCLDRKGISRDEADLMFDNDAYDAIEKCQNQIPFFGRLDTIRQCVLVDMAFNLGIGGLLKFKNMLAAIEQGNYERAAEEMISSAWYSQVGNRARRLEQMMRTGVMCPEYEGL